MTKLSSNCIKALILLIIMLGMASAVLSEESSSSGTWVLSRTVISSNNQDGRIPPGLQSVTEVGFGYKETDGDGKTYFNSMNWSLPPKTIVDGSTVTLTIEASSNPWANVSGWWNFCDWGATSEWKGVKMVNSYENGVERSGSMTFKFKPYASDEAWIQMSTGHDPSADQWYLVTWIYKKQKSGETGSTSTGTGTQNADQTSSTANPDASADLCKKARDAWKLAALKAKLAAANLEMTRTTINELNQQWLDARDSAYWSASIDVAFMAASLWSKPVSKVKWIQRLFGVGEATSQTAVVSIVEAGIKGMFKEGSKKFVNVCIEQGIDPAEVLPLLTPKNALNNGLDQLNTQDINARDLLISDTKKGAEAAAKKAYTKLVETLIVEDYSCDLKNPGNTAPPEVKEILRKEYAAPAAELLGLMISLQSTMDSAWSAHTKLESLRFAVKLLRDQELTRSEIYEQRKQDLEVALYAYNACLELHGKTREQGAENNED